MTALASSRGKRFAARVGDEITDVTASPYLSGIFPRTRARARARSTRSRTLPENGEFGAHVMLRCYAFRVCLNK